jgi:hypothetical protein
VRLLLGQKRVEAARALLDEALAERELSPGARNLMSQLRFAQGRTLDEGLAVAMRTPLYDGVAAADERTLDEDGAALFFEELPLAESVRAAQDAHIDARVRGQLLSQAWLRAALVDDVALAQSLLSPLQAHGEKLVPQLREALAGATAEERRYGLVHLWLRHESLQVMSCQGNSYDGEGKGTSAPALLRPGFVPAPFVDAALRERARAESQRLDALASDEAAFRAEQVALWAKAHPDDPRLPEDLHLAVDGTRHSCERARATAASKRAWKVLHERFPKSPWTRKTKYWYP